MGKLTVDGPKIHPDCVITNATFGGFTEIGRGSVILNSDMGDYSYCARYCDIANTSIGKFSNIASFVRVGPTDHPLDRASLHHFVYRSESYWDDADDDTEFFAHRASRRTYLGHDTWVGHGAIIRPEVTVGIGAVVAAGAVVTRDVPPYTVVAGVPAKPIRQRFRKDVVERMIALAWWDWSHERLRVALDDFRLLNAEAFLEKHGA